MYNEVKKAMTSPLKHLQTGVFCLYYSGLISAVGLGEKLNEY
ncbi:hypothetical protein CPS_0581 [Colwellia psychrerythraea 34H]|uniref:Uncharacterized protein n=1 Tax=Colwellia psychrerythraea (strain 34H / ATCC BAA-681) TaxID=167879 RepID=Q489D3_COLP3|nr:hypothetical protein CPS_0581 [Colwellia psychrerythraea 34H]